MPDLRNNNSGRFHGVIGDPGAGDTGTVYKLIHDISHRVADLATDLLEQPKKTAGIAPDGF